MLRLRIIQTRPEEPDTGRHTAELVDESGGVAATGHVVTAAEDVNLGGRIVTSLTFVGEGTLGKRTPDAVA